MSFHDGAQIDHVIIAASSSPATVAVVECSERPPPRAVRDGAGRPGTGRGHRRGDAARSCRRRPRSGSTTSSTPDLDPLLADLAVLMEDGRFDQMEAFVFPTGAGRVGLPARGHRLPRPRRSARRRRAARRPAATSTAPTQTATSVSSTGPPVCPSQQRPAAPVDRPACCRCRARRRSCEEVQGEIAPIGPDDRYSLLLIPLRRSTFGRPLFRTQDEELGLGFDTLRAFPPGIDVEATLALQPPAVRPLHAARRLAVPDQRRAPRRRGLGRPLRRAGRGCRVS